MKDLFGNFLMYCQKVQMTNFLGQFNKLTVLIDGHSKFNFKPAPDFHISLRLLPKLIQLKPAQF